MGLLLSKYGLVMVNYNKLNKKKEKIENRVEFLESEIAELKKRNQILEELKHDIGRFSSEALSFCEDLNTLISNDKSKSRIEDAAVTLFHAISMISPRMLYSDMELNRGQIGNAAKFQSGVYKKFDKANKILKQQAKKKKLKVLFQNRSNHTIDAQSSFDMIPFILLENAIKYSPSNGEISVSFDEMNKNGKRSLDVTVSSIGPFIDAENIKKVTERGFRGGANGNVSGQGLGLYIASNIAKYHNIKMEFNSAFKCDLDNVAMGEFSVKLSF